MATSTAAGRADRSMASGPIGSSTIAGNLAAVRRRELLDQPAHPSVADRAQSTHRSIDDRRDWPLLRCSLVAKNRSCTRISAGSRSASAITSVMFRRAAACESIRIGTPSNASSSWLTNVGSLCSPSPTAQMTAMSSSRVTSATSASAAMISGSRRASSIVTETLTSEVVTTSTDGPVLLEHLEDPPQKAVRHQHAGRRDVHDGDALLRRDGRQRAAVRPVDRA